MDISTPDNTPFYSCVPRKLAMNASKTGRGLASIKTYIHTYIHSYIHLFTEALQLFSHNIKIVINELLTIISTWTEK